RVLRYFVPTVLLIAALSFAFWLAAPLAWGAGPNVQRGAFAALAVLVLGYPCALGMATPLALIRGGGEAATRGVLMRSGDVFQVFPEIDRVVLDKTGTVTVGEPAVAEIVAVAGDDEEGTVWGDAEETFEDDEEGTFAGDEQGSLARAERNVLATAASAEAFSEHPLADAVLAYADERGIDYADPESFDSETGKGVRATVDGADVLVGKPGWLAGEGVDVGGTREAIRRLQERGLTVSGVAREGTLLGLLGIGDEVKADAAETVERMHEAGITPALLTGDDERTARAVADEVGIDRVLADVLPEEKRAEIARLQEAGHRVAMVGDGINDAPALTQADVGVAVGAGTDIAIESADVVLVGDRLGGVMDAHGIGAESYRRTRQNLATAFAFNGVGVAAATTGLVHAMIAMVLSVSAVLANSFAGQLLDGGGVDTDFAVTGGETGPVADRVAVDQAETS
ncbi:MAG: heavy metal translocating P-type ATPase, partial [Halobacteriales archaeon]